ncbi:PQQ-binding-like beta-propeller repeat protein [Candidatus Latescibacterota bacterium]
MKKLITLPCLMMIMAISIIRPIYPQIPDKNTWPEFRGKNCSGLARPDQPPPIDLVSTDNLLWKTPLLNGESSPCIWGDRIFLTGFDKEKKQLQVMCYDRTDGKLIWNRVVPVKDFETYHVIATPAESTPATDGERVYVHFGSCGLLCYDFEGKVLWTLELPPNDHGFGSGMSPIVAGDLVILPVRHTKEEIYLLALDSKTGSQAWKQPLPNLGHSSAILCGNQVVMHGYNFIAGYNIENGAEIWRVLVHTTCSNTPVTNDGVVYVASFVGLGEEHYRLPIPTYQELLKKHDTNGDSFISKNEFPTEFKINSRPEMENMPGSIVNLIDYWGLVDTDKNFHLDGKEWQAFLDYIEHESVDHGLVAIKTDGTGDVTESNILWKENEGCPEVSSPLYHEGRVYMVKSGGIVTCVNAVTGKLLYRERLRASGPYLSSPVAVNDRIYVASHKGTVVVFEAGDELNVLARNNLREKILATPAIVDNKIYLRTDKHLYAFGE